MPYRLQGGAIRLVVFEMRLLELLDSRCQFGGVGQGIAAVFQLDLDQLLLDHRLQRGALVRRAEIQLHPILKRRHANLAIQVAGHDHAVVHRRGNPVDDLSPRRHCQGQGADQPHWNRVFQNVCPIEKKY